jgi:hypothetical protein
MIGRDDYQRRQNEHHIKHTINNNTSLDSIVYENITQCGHIIYRYYIESSFPILIIGVHHDM